MPIVPISLSISLLSGGSLLVVGEGTKEGGKAGPKTVPSAVVEVIAPMPTEPLVTVTDPKNPRQPIPAHDGADYLKAIPGFSVIRKGGTDGDPVLRGMAGSRLVMLLDGEQLLGGCGMRMDPPTAYIFPESYDRITVIKGPETVLYGPGNSAGTVLFERIPKPFTEAGWCGSASVMAGSFGRHDEVVDATVGAPKFYVRGIGTRSHSGDYEDGNGQSIHSRFTRWSANTAVGWTPNEQTRIELTAAKSDGEAAYGDRTMDGTKFLRENVGFKFDVQKLSSLMERLEFQAYRNYVDHVMDNFRLRTFVPTMMAPEPSSNNPDRLTQGGRFAMTLRLAPSTQWVLGMDGQTNAHTSRTTSRAYSIPVESVARMDDARFRNTGLFTELTQYIDEHDRLLGGLRADRWNVEDRRAKVALSMMSSVPNPTQGQSRNETLTSGFLRYEREMTSCPVTAYVGMGHAERFPDYWEMINKESATSISAFATLPEKTTQVDLGLVKKSGAARYCFSAFAGSVKDFILIQSNVAKPAGMGGTRMATISRNIDARTWGGELSAEWAFTKVFKAESSLAYTRGENKTDDLPLAQIPPLEARLGFAYDDQTWSAGLLLRAVAQQDRFAKYQGNIIGQDLGRSPGFAVFSLNAGWRPCKYALLTMGIDNLFNRAYAEHISRNASIIPGYDVQTIRVDEPGRMIWLKLNLKVK